MDYLFGKPLSFWAEVNVQLAKNSPDWDKTASLIKELSEVRTRLYIAEGKLKAITELLP